MGCRKQERVGCVFSTGQQASSRERSGMLREFRSWGGAVSDGVIAFKRQDPSD